MVCEFGVSALSNSLGTLVVDYLVKPVVCQLRYACCFENIVGDLKEQSKNLRLAQKRLEHDVDEAKRQTQLIEQDVNDWLKEANEVEQYVQSLEAEMEETKSCFSNWCPNWRQRYQLSKKAEKKTLNITTLLVKASAFDHVGHRATLSSIELYSSADFMPSKSSNLAFSQIMEALEDNTVNMIALYGMGGVGKTTLVKQVQKQAKELKLFNQLVMAVVSQTPDPKHIQGQIADFLGLTFGEETKEGRANRLKMRLMNEEKILIILDDVWKEINLEEIGIPLEEDHSGCKILLTTRLLQVCSLMRSQKTIKLDGLEENEAWDLFQMNANLNNVLPAVKEMAVKVAKECGGLPIAIVTLGRALRDKTLSAWEVAFQSLQRSRLMDIEFIEEDNKNAYLCLKLSYDHLRLKETKTCFLLCSLFPENYMIEVEDLVRFAWGLELYQVHNSSIEEARRKVYAAIDYLKASSLLLDCGERFVQMHDMVRDVALWIASKENSFMIKSEVGLKKWPRDESLEPYTAISFMASQINELPKGLVYPNLKILLLGGYGWLKTSSAFLEGMKELQVFSLYDRSLMLHAFNFQTNLRTLHLKNCRFYVGFSSLGKLKKLQILSFQGSDIGELPNDIAELTNLILLDVSYCESLKRIPSLLLQRLSQLQELYLGGSRFIEWATQNTSGEETDSASLSELTSLSHLAVLSLEVCSEHLPKDFVFPRLQKYDVCIDRREIVQEQRYDCYIKSYFENCQISRSLKVEASALHACKNLFCNMESLALKSLVGCKNLVPMLDEGGLNKLTSLVLACCEDMKCLVDTTKQQVPNFAFSNLVKLSLSDMFCLEELCSGHQPPRFLQELTTVSIWYCNDMFSAVPVLQNLEKVEVQCCDKMQVIFQTFDGLVQIEEENRGANLKILLLQSLPELRSIWQRPLHHVNFQSLKVVHIYSCNKLTYLFPTSVAKSLVQLETLRVYDCLSLEEIIPEREVSTINLQGLTEVSVDKCNNLTSLTSLSYGHSLENLRELKIQRCSRLEYTFPISMAEGLPRLNVVHLEDLPQLKERDGNDIVLTLPSLQELQVQNCPQLAPFIISAKLQKLSLCKMVERNQLCNRILPQLRRKAENMEYLAITNFEELFQLQGEYNLSSLKVLWLFHLPELRVVWKGSVQFENFKNLTTLRVSGCKRLRYIFSPIIARNLPQLSSLTISGCEELEQIIDKDQTSSEDHSQSLCFRNLTEISIKECENLKSLFTVGVARGLPKLEYLSVEQVSKLEQVFEQGDEEKEKVMQLPQLKVLWLHGLPSLLSFIPMGYHFVFPSLDSLWLTECPKITTRFTIDSNQFAHAKTKLKEDSVTVEETSWSIGDDIWWSR